MTMPNRNTDSFLDRLPNRARRSVPLPGGWVPKRGFVGPTERFGCPMAMRVDLPKGDVHLGDWYVQRGVRVRVSKAEGCFSSGKSAHPISFHLALFVPLEGHASSCPGPYPAQQRRPFHVRRLVRIATRFVVMTMPNRIPYSFIDPFPNRARRSVPLPRGIRVCPMEGFPVCVTP